MGKYFKEQLVAHYLELLRDDPEQAEQILGNYSRNLSNRKTHLPGIKGNDEIDAAVKSLNDFYKKLAEISNDLKSGNDIRAKESFDEAVKIFGSIEKNVDAASKQRGTSLDKKLNSRLTKDDRDDYETLLEDRLPAFETLSEMPQKDYKGKELFEQLGPAKSAAEWIEDLQERVRNSKKIGVDEAAMLLAARQLAECKYDDLKTLQAKKISGAALMERAEQLKNSNAFKDFVLGNSEAVDEDEIDEYTTLTTDLAKKLTDGHGGGLEKEFESYIKNRDDVQKLPKELFGRYQAKESSEYADYESFIQANKKDYQAELRNDDPKLYHKAAQMMAAFTLKVNGEKFSKERLDRITEQNLRSPEFRYMRRLDPDSLYLAAKGDAVGFAGKLDGLQTELIGADKFSVRGDVISTFGANMQSGLYSGTKSERKANSKYLELESATRSTFKFLGKQGGYPDSHDNLVSLANNMCKPPDYTDPDPKRMTEDNITAAYRAAQENVRYLSGLKDDPNAKKMMSLMKPLIQAGTNYLNPPEFKDGKKTAEEQRKAYQQKEALKFMKAYESYNKSFRKLYQEEFNKVWQPIDRDLRKAGIKPLSNLLVAKKAKGMRGDEIRDQYMKARGPKFRAMVDAAAKYKQGDSRTAMNLIDRVLDYQNGKEKVMKGAAGERFNDSLMLLASVTVGTPLEKTVLEPQLDKINRIRGAKPGSPDYVSKEEFASHLQEKQDNVDKTIAKNEAMEKKFFEEEMQEPKNEVPIV